MGLECTNGVGSYHLALCKRVWAFQCRPSQDVTVVCVKARIDAHQKQKHLQWSLSGPGTIGEERQAWSARR
jgi:hypothetical protein